VKTVRTECLDHFVIFGERHLRHLLKDFVGHYLTERYHQGVGSQIIRPSVPPSNDNAELGRIGRRSSSADCLTTMPECRRTSGREFADITGYAQPSCRSIRSRATPRGVEVRPAQDLLCSSRRACQYEITIDTFELL
jgi:hypothetical protein